MHLLDEAALVRVKPDALLIDVARGSVVNEVAVARALQEGRLGRLRRRCLQDRGLAARRSAARNRCRVARTSTNGADAASRFGGGGFAPSDRAACGGKHLDALAGPVPRDAIYGSELRPRRAVTTPRLNLNQVASFLALVAAGRALALIIGSNLGPCSLARPTLEPRNVTDNRGCDQPSRASGSWLVRFVRGTSWQRPVTGAPGITYINGFQSSDVALFTMATISAHELLPR